ncbi:fasciclin domain-containing protein [Joostella sp.]|uniref:fasciclin domain-containing protein n=1 Tax=Joostella sp. TaxID=2231138 RepID=UPI003A91D6CE
MKNILGVILLLGILMVSCDDNGGYLDDGGVSSPELGVKTMDFLRSHSQLDTLAMLIDKAEMAEVVNGDVTLFAPNNLAINKYVDRLLSDLRQEDSEAEFTVNDIPKDTLTKYLGGYIFEGKLTRANIPIEQGEIYTSINGETRRISLEPSNDYSDQLGYLPDFVYFTYKNEEEWDVWDDIEDDDKIIVKTSDLQSTNGIIHVLQGTHVLFNYKSND